MSDIKHFYRCETTGCIVRHERALLADPETGESDSESKNALIQNKQLISLNLGAVDYEKPFTMGEADRVMAHLGVVKFSTLQEILDEETFEFFLNEMADKFDLEVLPEEERPLEN